MLKINILPKLNLISHASIRLNKLIDAKLKGNASTAIQTEINTRLKQADPLFIRLYENANRVIYEQKQNLLSLEKQATETNDFFHFMQFILITVLLLISIIVFYYISLNIQAITKDLEVQKNKAIEGTRSKSEFLANMSHEIRTPLNAIVGFISLLRAKKLDEESLHFLQTVDDSSQNLLSIINDILDFSKIESNNLSMDIISFSPNEFKATIDLFQAKAEEKNIFFIINFDKALPASIKSDPLRLKQIIANLLSNAIKFTPKDKKITLSVCYEHNRKPNPSYLTVSVKDQGIGIAKEQQANVFSAFSQADSFTTRKYGGTGLGLSISTRLIELLGGTVSLESELGKGSLFSFRVPVTLGETLEKPKVNILTAKSYSGHVLLVEDNKTNQLLMKTILKKQGLTFDIANDGVEAVDCFHTGKYDLVLMDENMPNMNGIVATQRIRAYENTESISPTPIVALTANAIKGDRERFLAAGMDDYLQKPLNLPELFRVLSLYVSAD